MKFLILINLTLFVVCSSAQKNTSSRTIIDSLKEYSYLVLHISDNNPIGNSTGFFIRRDNNLFFVTTYHTCSCVDVFEKQIYQQEWDSLYIRLYKEDGGIIYHPINLIPLQKQRTVEYFVNHPDLCVYEVNNLPQSLKVNSIETIVDFMQNPDIEPDKTIFYGFPRETNDTAYADKLIVTKVEGTMKFPLRQPIELVELNTIDTNIVIIQPKTYKGASGSPVFFQYFDTQNPKSTIIAFAGMVFGTDNSQNCIYVLKSNYILSAIKELNKRIMGR